MKTPMILIAACAMWLAGCTMQATYRHAPTTGRFSGEPRMVAIAPNTFFFFLAQQGHTVHFHHAREE